MRPDTRLTTSNVSTWEELRRFVSADVSAIVAVLNGRIGLTDNCQTALVTATFTSANTTTRVPHNLKIPPTGYIKIGANASVNVFDGNQNNTSSDLYLQASAAATVRLLVF